ncbi:carboxymuconolactone decarboxylase family protein [Mycobacterium malmoense]|uniref:carboxymuconolactone decarboxylase family protein n=1 Tax=Mycobacterium malmoense TaxID=1780 RepID=UPI001C30046E|nr:carboxymuconolactone decarboxylase family protein [Mycobacterium malmoense]
MTSDSGEPDRTARGLSLMEGMLGPEVVQRLTTRNQLVPDWHRWTTDVLFGDVWQSPRLELRLRSMVTVAALIPMSCPRELSFHMRGALHNGVGVEELAAIIEQVGFYAGWPAAGQALNILNEMVTESSEPARIEAVAASNDQSPSPT